jgi:hypothetical protein
MREKEHTPLLASGFKDISEANLHTEFVAPFTHGQEHRNNLLNEFKRFLNRFKELNLSAEIWIDGSFATQAPDPADIDVVFYFKPEEIDALEPEKKEIFNKLFQSRKFIKNLYKVEVFQATSGIQSDYTKWQETFGTCYDNITPKGIFRLKYSIQ